ncbi:MAG: selenide, water dikinase SelD [Bacteroidota bacterium]|jgi:selenide,water dikinase
MSEEIRLTQFSKGSGCGCKIAPAVLESILQKTNGGNSFPNLLVGNDSNDDAAVLELDNGTCLISTVDFFTPIVDDPFDFGRIAAANSISDVYAMGGTPQLAVAILGFPVDKLPAEVAGTILKGAREVCTTAGIPLAGGHSIDSQEPIFGLSVNGTVAKQHLKRNNTAQPGDVLFLTKPLGIGILSAAAKRSLIQHDELHLLINVMVQLNSVGAELGTVGGVHAMTDVTGFGLLGHLLEMCEGANLSAEVYMNKLPIIEGAEKYRDQFVFPDNTYRNWNAYEKKVQGINGPEFITLCDPQTSGGLLLAVAETAVDDVIDILNKNGLQEHIQPIGRMLSAPSDFRIKILPA